MNKVSILALLTCVSFSPVAMALADNGSGIKEWSNVVHFDGLVFESSCKISTSDRGKHVSLPPVRFSEIPTSETRTNAVSFKLTLENCGLIAEKPPKIAIQFNDNNVTQQGYLKNSNEALSNVGLLLMTKDGKKIDVGERSSHLADDEGGHYNSNKRNYSFSVGYIKVSDPGVKSGTSGPVTAQVNYHITYF
ncbi:fimbrial protein [Buttiauxella noackiae]|uniref:fimbrial protein n=1 Tax=Buttiauxella noackiae TaxID=82992 RepID=UPI0028D07B28|nr:fimbrial protein [Buttiauxella noackiae]